MLKLLFGAPVALLLVMTLAVAPVYADVDIFTWGTVGDHHELSVRAASYSLRGDGAISQADALQQTVGGRVDDGQAGLVERDHQDRAAIGGRRDAGRAR